MSFVGLARRAAPLARRAAPVARRVAPLGRRPAPLARRAAPLARRVAPLLIAGAAGAVLGRYVEGRRMPQPALPAPVEESPRAPAEQRPPAPVEAAEDVQDAEVVAEEEVFEADTLAEEAEEPAGRPSTVDFKALASHPALSHEPPPGDPPELAVRAALTEVSLAHAASVSVEVHGGVAYLRGQVESADAIAAMLRCAADVSEIQAVENLLHLPGTPPPLTSERG